MGSVAWIGFAAGVVILLITAGSVLGTLIVPRATAPRLTVLVTRTVRRAFLLITDRVDAYRTRDRIDALAGPALLMALLAAWVALVFLSFSLLLWPFVGGFGNAVVLTGASMFTLGFATPHGAAPTALVFLCAMSGLVIVALQIAYLPTLYAAFNRRETLVTMLEFLGGVPAWGPEILMRHELIDNTDRLGWLYERWTEWAADVSESHTTYPQLVYFRSPNPYRSWVVGLLAVMDAAALQLSLSPLSAPGAARPLLRMGYVALRELAEAVGVDIDPDPDPADPIQLTKAEYDDAVAKLRAVGWKIERDADIAWTHFHGWRVNYEAAAYGLCAYLNAPPALWSGPRRRGRNEVMGPARPAHRVPLIAEKDKLIQVRTSRRAARHASAHAGHGPGGGAVHELGAAHDGGSGLPLLVEDAGEEGG
ncbi:MAG: hypothetical protein ABSA40_10650 [Candidatus Dormibacteria bacterium]